jgi:hypothetical protein
MYALYKQNSTGFESVSYTNHGYGKTSTALLASYVPFNTGLSKSIDDNGNFFHTAQVNASNIMLIKCNVNNKTISHSIININNYDNLCQHSRIEYHCTNTNGNYCQLVVKDNGNIIPYIGDFKAEQISQANVTVDNKTLSFILFQDNNNNMKLGIKAFYNDLYAVKLNNESYGKITHDRTGIVKSSVADELIFASDDKIHHICFNFTNISNNYSDTTKWDISTIGTINIEGTMEFATQNTANKEYVVKTNKHVYRYNYINRSINISPCTPTQKELLKDGTKVGRSMLVSIDKIPYGFVPSITITEPINNEDLNNLRLRVVNLENIVTNLQETIKILQNSIK